MTEKTAGLIDILLVEDNPADVRLIREVLKETKLVNALHVVGDGIEALRFLHGEEPYADAPAIDLLLLDLNLPKKSGQEVLEEIKEDPHLRVLPVVILTTSSAESDVLAAYESYANCYITKPLDLEQFMKVVHSIEDFWLAIVRLPPERRG